MYFITHMTLQAKIQANLVAKEKKKKNSVSNVPFSPKKNINIRLFSHYSNLNVLLRYVLCSLHFTIQSKFQQYKKNRRYSNFTTAYEQLCWCIKSVSFVYNWSKNFSNQCINIKFSPPAASSITPDHES